MRGEVALWLSGVTGGRPCNPVWFRAAVFQWTWRVLLQRVSTCFNVFHDCVSVGARDAETEVVVRTVATLQSRRRRNGSHVHQR